MINFSDEELKMFLKMSYEKEAYMSFIKRLIATDNEEEKKKVLEQYAKFSHDLVENPNKPVNFAVDFKDRILVSERVKLEGNEPFLWDLMVQNAHLGAILTSCSIFLMVNPQGAWKEIVDDGSYLFAELDFYETGMTKEKKQQLFKKLTGKKFKGKELKTK